MRTIRNILILASLLMLLVNGITYAAPGDTISKSIRVSWDANTEEDLAGYRVYLAKELLVEIIDPLATSVELTADALVNGENIFNLTAYDTSGNESFFSNDAILVYDGTMPGVPTNVEIRTAPNTRITIETWE